MRRAHSTFSPAKTSAVSNVTLPAPSEHTAIVTAAKPGREPRIPAKVRRGCDLLASGECKTVTAAASRVGLSREHFSRMVNRPHIQAFIARESRRTIALGSLRASHRLLELIDAASEHVSADVSKHVLAVQGIRPPDAAQPSVNIGVSVGYVIDLSGTVESKTVTVDTKPDAKPLIDQ